ncbi:MAG: response regulator transcription factor [Chloroflexota bacterium]
MIKVIVCDDQAVVREGLAAILSTAEQIEVVGLAADGAEAVALVQKQPPDLVLMDLKMPRMNGVRATQAIREQFPAVAVLVLTTYATDEWVFDAIRAGASGYLLKDTYPDDLVQAIEDTVNGRSHLDPQIAGKLLTYVNQEPSRQPPKELAIPLSAREQEILTLLVQGLTNPDIGQQLHLSAGTVRNYITEIFNKLGVSDRVQAAVTAVRLGLVPPE